MSPKILFVAILIGESSGTDPFPHNLEGHLDFRHGF